MQRIIWNNKIRKRSLGFKLSLPLACLPEFFLDGGGIVLILHEPLQEGCVAIVPFTLDPVHLSGTPPLGKANLEVVDVSGAKDEEGGTKDDEEQPGRSGKALRSF